MPMFKAAVCTQCGEKFPPTTAMVTGGLCMDCFIKIEGILDDDGDGGAEDPAAREGGK